MEKRIAIPVNGDDVLDTHFGHCKFFMLIDVKDDKVIAKEKVVPPPHEPGLLPKWLSEKEVTEIIAGGIGQKAIQLLNQNNINVLVGAPNLESDEIIAGYLNNTLSLNVNNCSH
nr:NifB/NifX family molybdenum-iron cluster-binding protein [uncultured Carboxylicivirga sp.]